MSSSASNTATASKSTKPATSRQQTPTAIPAQEPSLPMAPSPSAPQPTPKKDVRYTCFIRLPFPRGDFEDPPIVEWDAVKDKALWKLISKTSNSKDLDWADIATRFDVDLPFLLQQAAWLYERHFDGMRKQMQKLGLSQASTPAVPETGSPLVAEGGGIAMQRQSSRESKVPSVITTLKALPSQGSDGSNPGTPRIPKPPISRTPSTTTVTQSKVFAGSVKQHIPRSLRSGIGSSRKAAMQNKAATDVEEDAERAQGHEGAPDSESEDEPSLARSQAYKRASLGKKPKLRPLSSDGDGEDDDEEGETSSGGYLPFAAGSNAKPAKQDHAAAFQDTARKRQGDITEQASPATERQQLAAAPPLASESSESSATSSAQPAPSASSEPISSDSVSAQRIGQRSIAPPGPLSPRHRAQLANASVSPRYRREGSDGSPSMGSSFSDLDDSVTQSALEDALLSNMNRGGMSIASRMRDAWRQG